MASLSMARVGIPDLTSGRLIVNEGAKPAISVGTASLATEGRATFLRAVLRDHSRWATDIVDKGTLPRGWQPLLLAAFAAMSDVMLAAPTSRVRFTRVDCVHGRLRIVLQNDAQHPTPRSIVSKLEAILVAATCDACDRCPQCGRLFGSAPSINGVALHLRRKPDCTPSLAMSAILKSIDAWLDGDG